MLRRILLASVGAIALTGAAFAADLPSRGPPPIYLPPPPFFTWTGVYVGINAGYHWGGSATNFTGTDTDGGGLGTALGLGLIPATGAGGASGAIAGGTIGYNWQINSFVLGLEVDIDGAGGRKTSSLADGPPLFVPVFTTSSQGLDWLGTVRGRIGWALIDRLLIYGTGGLAFGESRASFSVSGPTFAPPLFDSVSTTRSVGWAAGGGIEYAVNNNWSVKVEYLHYDLGSSTGSVFYTYGANSSTLSGETRHDGNIVRGGINYKFDWGPGPVVAKY
jgi:outer membrane immunogenic protein